MNPQPLSVKKKKKQHIGYKVEEGGDFTMLNGFKGFITWFDGEQIFVHESERFVKKTDAWKWIEERLKNNDF